MAAVTRSKKAFHIAKAERNEQFYHKHKLTQSGFDEWAVTVLFYVCVHYVDAVLCGDLALTTYHKEPENHFARLRAVSKCATLSKIAVSYTNLLHRSIDARYKMLNIPSGSLSNLHTDYQSVRNHIRTELGLT
jgi:hypothetical protein